MEACDIVAQTGCNKTCKKENIKDKNEQEGKMSVSKSKQTKNPNQTKLARGLDCKNKISSVDKIALRIGL